MRFLVLFVLIRSFCQPSDLSLLLKTATISPNNRTGIHEIKLDSSVVVSNPMTISSQNLEFMSTSDLTTVAPAIRLDENEQLFSLSNSSLSFTKVAFSVTNQIIATVDEASHFRTESCLLESNGQKLFEVDGTLMLINTTLVQPTATSSLIVSPSANGEVGLFACRVEQTQNVARSPILGDTLRTLQLCHCEIRNVSHCPSTSSTEVSQAGQTSSLTVGNSFQFNEDVLDGNVFVGLNEHFSFTSLNNTHFHTRRTGTSNTERQIITEANTTTNNLFIFDTDTFEGCTVHGSSGGAISFTHSANLEIGVCSFQSCSVTGTYVYGGAVYFWAAAPSGQTAVFETSNFTSCSSPFESGAVHAVSSKIGTFSSTVNLCRFIGNKAAFIDSFQANKAQDVTIHFSLFKDGDVTRYEGPVKAFYCRGLFEMTFNELNNCTGRGSGQFGVREGECQVTIKRLLAYGFEDFVGQLIYIGDYPNSQIRRPELVLEDCWIETGKISSGGVDIYVDHADFLNKEKIVGCYSTSKRLSVDYPVKEGETKSSFLITPDITIDTMNGEDKVFCWVPGNGKGCSTIADTLPRLSVLFEGKLLLKCDENSDSVQMEEGDLTIGKRQLEVVGDGKDKVRVKDQSTNVLFSITTGSLVLSSVSLVPSTTSTLAQVSDGGSFKLTDAIVDGTDQSGTVSTKPFFVGRKGTLTFDSVRVSSFVFQNYAPIEITNKATSHLTIQSSNFTSITRKEGSGVVVSAALLTDSTVTIDDCRFTDCHSLDEDYGGLGITNALIDEPKVYDRGGVVRASGGNTKSGTIEITNSHFERNSIAGGAGAGVILVDLGIATVTQCHFEDLQAGGIQAHGAALSLIGVTSATVTSCSFDSCEISKNQYGAYAGALSVVDSQITAKNCSFTRCSCAHVIGVIFLHAIQSGSSVEDFVLSACLDEDWSLFFVWSSHGLTLSNISFIDCGNSGKEWTALEFGILTPNKANVDGIFVASSSPSLKKGKIGIESKWLSGTSSLTFSSCQFLCDEPFITDEKDFSAGFIAQLRVAAEADLTSTVDETMCGHPSRSCQTVAFALKLCPSVLVKTEFVLISIGEGEHLEDPLVIDTKIKLISSDVDSQAHLKATDSTASLLTVNQNSLLIVESLSIIISSVDPEKAIVSSSGTLTLTSITFINPSPSPTLSGHLIDFTKGSGTVSKCVFPACGLSQRASIVQIQSDASVDLKEQDLDLTNSELGTFLSIVGTASIESSSFSNITSLSSFMTGSGSLTIVDSTFFSIKEKASSSSPCRSLEFSVGDGQALSIGAESKTVFFTSCSSGGDGGAVHCSISGTGMLSISHTTFDECSSQTIGGGLAIVCSADVISSSLSIQSTFTSCSSTARPDNALHLKAYSFESLIDSSRWRLNDSALKSPDNDSVLWGEDLAEQQTSKYRTLTLLYYLLPYRQSEISTSVDGRDGDGCGHSTRPCSSFSTAHSHLTGDQSLTLKVDGKTKLDGTVSLSKQDLAIEPQSGVGVVEVVEDGQISNNHPSTTSHKISITHISFDLSSATAQSLISSNNGELSLSSCSITSPTTISSTLFSVSGGTLKVTSLDLTDLSFTAAPIELSSSGVVILKQVSNNDFTNGGVGSLVEMDGGQLEMELSTFEKAALSSSLISGSGSVSIHNSSFTSLVDSTTSSSNTEPARALTLSVGNNQKVELGAESKPVKFKLCSSREEGGALHCSISGSGVLAISHTTFDECSSRMVGGGLAIVCAEGVRLSSLSIQSTFTSCSSTARPDNALHLKAYSFESLIDSSRWRLNDNALKSPENDDVLWGEDQAEETESKYRSMTLLYYLFPYRHSEISTSVDGRDGEGCGHSTRPCSSFGTAHSHLVGDHTLTLEVIGKTRLYGTISLSKQDLAIEPQSGVGVVEVVSDGQISNNHPSTTSHKVTITHISFDLSSATAQSLISSNNGELSLTSCFIASSTSISAKIFSVSGGTIQLTTLNLTGLHFNSIPIELSSSTGSFFNVTDISTATARLLSASNSTLHLTQTDFSGQRPISPTNQEDICGWSTGFVSLDNCTTTLTGSSFAHFANGAIAMKDGHMTIKTSSFDENSPHFTDFPSFHRNIVCVGNGLIEIETLNGGDGSTDKLSSGWMKMEENCSVVSELVEPYEVFFIPSISKNVVSYEKKTKLFDVTIEGERLIPCGLSLEVFEVLKGTRKNSTTVDPLSSSPKNWIEKSFSVTLNESTLLNSLSAEPEWHARLLFGVDGTTTSFKLKESLATIKKAHTTETMKWLLPVIIGVSALLLLILLILLLLWCRQRRKTTAPLASQAELNDLPTVLDEKMEIVDENTVGTTAFVFDNAAEKGSHQIQPAPLNDDHLCQMSEEISPDVGVVRGMMMDGREEAININRRNTLFNRLHRPAPHHQNQTIDKKSIEAQIATGLVRFDVASLAAYLSNFSPHSIIVQDNNEVLFNLSHDEKQGTTQNNGTMGNEAQRWQAPEQTPNEKGVDKTTNPSHGAVFSLGLVLWEIETELVPFRELDAANAQRALATGTGLDLNLVADSELRGKIEQCLSLNPEERPTLADISSFLSSRSGEIPKQPNGSDLKQNVQFASRI